MNISDEYTVKIEKLINEGAGIARIDGVPVFIENSCPNDVLKIKITKKNKNYYIGEIIEIIEKTNYRVNPVCALSKICGSCNWLHIDYSEQLKQKKNIVYETIKNISGIDINVSETLPSDKITEYRCKVQIPIQQTKVSKRILSGYYKRNSHELINIKYCPMQPKIINEIAEYIKTTAQEFGISGYDEKNNSGLLRHIIFRISSDEKNLLIIFVLNSDVVPAKLKKLSEDLISKYPIIKGICANFNTLKTNVILGNNTQTILGQDYYIEQLDDMKYKISANSFFQINPLCAKKIFNKVKSIITDKCENPVILDAYSGVSSFGIWLSSIAKEVISVEESKSSTNDAIENIKLNNINNLKIINGDAAKEFNNLISQNIKFDVSLVDPPRKGCSEQSIEFLNKLTKKYIVYISCNPATLARDIKLLLKHSFKPIYIQPVDMFPNTYHIETIALLERDSNYVI